MAFIDVILSKIVPHDCINCGLEGGLLCQSCLESLPAFPERCYRCHRPSTASLTCQECQQSSSLYRVLPVTFYKGAAKDLVWRLKSAGAQEAAAVMASAMTRLAKECGGPYVVSVPTATKRIRRRGYDQSKLLGRCLAKQAGLYWMDCLARSGQTHQVGSGRGQRRQQLETAFRVTHRRFVRGAHILLVDDVVTTGATLEAAASVLKAAGAARVEAVTFAQPLFRKDLVPK